MMTFLFCPYSILIISLIFSLFSNADFKSISLFECKQSFNLPVDVSLTLLQLAQNLQEIGFINQPYL